MKPPFPRLAALCLAASVVAGCTAINPWWRQGTWQAQGVNDHNIGVLVQNPRDLMRGQHEAGPAWRTGAAAVDNLWHDRVKPLDSVSAPALAGPASTPGAPAPDAGDAGSAASPGTGNAGSAADAGQQPDGGS